MGFGNKGASEALAASLVGRTFPHLSHARPTSVVPHVKNDRHGECPRAPGPGTTAASPVKLPCAAAMRSMPH